MRFQGKVWEERPFWVVEIRALDVMTQGHTRAEALVMIADAVEALVNRSGFQATVYPGAGDAFELGANDDAALEALRVDRSAQAEGR